MFLSRLNEISGGCENVDVEQITQVTNSFSLMFSTTNTHYNEFYHIRYNLDMAPCSTTWNLLNTYKDALKLLKLPEFFFHISCFCIVGLPCTGTQRDYFQLGI